MNKEQARLPRGFIDKTSSEIKEEQHLSKLIAQIFELYGFENLQTPIFEYSSVLGKFLPDDDRPNEGVFSLQDEDEQWLSLRYDLTAPLARYVAQNFAILPKPYKSYRTGPVFRNEKPGPGRFRQFIQFDADIIGSTEVSTDVELCMMAADVIENLGINRGLYVIGLNNRKILDALLALLKVNDAQKLQILRSVDKYDKFGANGVAQLLGAGRLDESGDFSPGVGLKQSDIDKILLLLQSKDLKQMSDIVGSHPIGQEAIYELQQMQQLIAATAYDDRIIIDPSIVRGLGYYTGPIFEAKLLFDVVNEANKKVVFGAIGGGGRYDNLVSRFQSIDVPATGFSIGLSRLLVALQMLKKAEHNKVYNGPVVILRMDNDIKALTSYYKMAKELRANNIACEIYSAKASMKAQLKYADRKNAPCVIIQGSRELEAEQVQIKDLRKGAELASSIKDNETWRLSQPAQITVALGDIVTNVLKIINGNEL